MKKIKSKLIYVNPSYKLGHRADSSPSPDRQNRSGLQKTDSPSKEVQQFYNVKHTLSQFVGENNKRRDLHQSSKLKGAKSKGSVNLSSKDTKSNEVDLQGIHEGIKLKQPGFSGNQLQSSTKELQYESCKSQLDSSKNYAYMTPKSKNSNNYMINDGNNKYFSNSNNARPSFPMDSIEWRNQSDYGKLMKIMYSFQINNESLNKSSDNIRYENAVNYFTEYTPNKNKDPYNMHETYDSPVNQNKNSKKKLQLLSFSHKSSSKQPNHYKSPSSQHPNKNSNYKMTPTREVQSPQSISQNSYKIQPPSSHKKKLEQQSEQKDRLIQLMTHQLQQKQRQLQKMGEYVKEYENLGLKNQKMQGEMQQILHKLIKIKKKEQQQRQLIKSSTNRIQQPTTQFNPHLNYEHNQSQTHSSQTINPLNYNPLNYNPFSKHDKSYLQGARGNTVQLPESEIQPENYHHKISHKKTLTDQYIKISDELSSSSANIEEQEEQSYKLNGNHGFEGKRRESVERGKRHRKMGSVGARLKETLKAKNEQFVASFDDSLFNNSSSSSVSHINSQRGIPVATKEKQPQNSNNLVKNPPKQLHSFTEIPKIKQQQHLKTEQTEGQSIEGIYGNDQDQLQLESFVEGDSLAEGSNEDKSETLLLNESSDTIRASSKGKWNYQEEETTLKKPKVKYVIRKKTEIQQQYDSTHDKCTIQHLQQSNKQLTQIIAGLIGYQQKLFQQLMGSVKKQQNTSKSMHHIQASLFSLRNDFTQIINRVTIKSKQSQENMPIEDHLSKELRTMEERMNDLCQRLGNSTNEVKKREMEHREWIENNNCDNFIRKSLPILNKFNSFGPIKTHQINLNNKQTTKDINHPNHYHQSQFQTNTKRQTSKRPSNQQSNSSQQQSPGSPSFTYLQDTGSFFTESFKLSNTNRSNPSNHKFNYTSNIQDQPFGRSINYEDMINGQLQQKDSGRVARFDNSAILINENSSSESNLLNSSKATSQFVNQMQSARVTSENNARSGGSNQCKTTSSKMRSENSQIRINFDDLQEDALPNQQYRFDIVERSDSHQQSSNPKGSQRSSNIVKSNKPIELMKSSFGPIVLQNEMSYSQKGDSVIGQSRDHVSEDGLPVREDTSPRRHNRPRENSSINIFFSSDSICKSQYGNLHTPETSNNLHHNEACRENEEGPNFYNNSLININYPGEGQESSYQLPFESYSSGRNSQKPSHSSGRISKGCEQCLKRTDKIGSLETEAAQMRRIIAEVSEERDGLKKLIKSKVEIIDSLQISLKELQSLSSLQQIKFGNEQAPKNQSILNNEIVLDVGNQVNKTPFNDPSIALGKKAEVQQQEPQWYKSVNEFQYIPQSSLTVQQGSTVSYLKSKKLNQIEDVLAISSQLRKQSISQQKIESLKSIEMEIQEQLRREQGQFSSSGIGERGRPIDWARGSFSNVQELRERSFDKTKAILLRLISLIRELIAEGNPHTMNTF